jgi:hypothetical protein
MRGIDGKTGKHLIFAIVVKTQLKAEGVFESAGKTGS